MMETSNTTRPQHLLLNEFVGYKHCHKKDNHTVRYPATIELNNFSIKGEKNKKKPKRRVHFKKTAKVRACLSIDDYTDEEYFNSWMTPEEFFALKKETRSLVLGKSANGDRRCRSSYRGLESHTREGLLERESYRLAGLMAVINEQARQRMSGEQDDARISLVYRQAIGDCAKKPIERALKDEEDIKTGIVARCA
eukprot:CAMPEP_0202454516 /NCGR_PEP_ID=MMETSP1360-20130828/12222_1 /ASSEMBLY_ACC=CAM_ASM_000848 /TAXON_ID=515479 /ORGANISM="Licmophora paradoxa, Strain CCMP2313" /LENGTH=194 /DNA_ID=CAMNT_0049073845 /DNA_START=49 /DNA_END=633 /DNA_ORIENTATION=+